jgi:hypothetical protein
MIELLQEAYELQTEALTGEIVTLLEEVGIELLDDLTVAELPDVIDEILEAYDLDEETAMQLEAFGKKLRRGIAKAANFAGRVARKGSQIHGAHKKRKLKRKMRIAKFKGKVRRKVAGVKKSYHQAKKTARSAFKAGKAGKRLTGAQKKQRQKAAKKSGQKRKGKRVRRKYRPALA